MSSAGEGLESAWYRGAWWLWLLRPLEAVFRLLTALRRWLYRSGILSTVKADVPLVVIGNITVGGTGKTPVVIALVEALQKQGLRPGVVSRGYGAEAGRFPHRVGPQSQAADCGDEALLLYQRTNCPCVVSPNRGEAVQTLQNQVELDIVLADDGLQHYALARDYEVVLIDAKRGLGNGFCLPAGPLRESPARLQSVDCILQRGLDDADNGVYYEPEALVNVRSGQHLPLVGHTLGSRVDAVAGIGQPEQFFQTLKELGFIPETHRFPDHHVFTREDLQLPGNSAILMTEKDAVKCRDIANDNTWYLKITARLPSPLVSSIIDLARVGNRTGA